MALFIGVSARTVGRFHEANVLHRLPDKSFNLRDSVQAVLHYFMVRERWSFQQLRRFRIFDELTGDRFEPPRSRPHG